jgi:arylsulfatase A-like enzyme
MEQERPNILLVFVDNQPADMMGCSGNSEIHTPNLDSLAENAVRFSEAYCPNAMCSPCRATALTGLMPSQHGIHTWIDDDCADSWPPDWNAIGEFEALPQLLTDSGYETALIGKYHLGVARKPQNGFKTWVTMQIGHVQSFYDNKMIVGEEEFVSPDHSVEFFTRHAVDYIAAHDPSKGAPFFLFLTYPAPYGHWPSVRGEPTNKFADLYRGTRFESVPREGVSAELMDWILLKAEKEGSDDEFYRELAQIPNDLPTLRNYYSQMSIVDEGVGRVLGALEDNGLTRDTMVIYTSDHGMSLGQHGFWGHGEDTWPSNMHREANHIPFIVKPADDRIIGRVRHSVVGTINIFPTLLDYAGLEMPESVKIPSRSLRPLLETGGDCDWDDAVFMEQEETRAIRTDKWLLMSRFGPTSYCFRDELYDLVNDPDERRNLIDDPQSQSVRAELQRRIDDFFATHSDGKWDLWNGGTVKSNSTRPFLWREVWGEGWSPSY